VPIQELPPADPDILPPPPREPIPIQLPQEPPPSVIPVIEPVETEAVSSPVETNNPIAVNPEPLTPREILLEQGMLEDGDQVYEQDGSLYDVHQFSGEAGQVITITVESDEFDTFLAVFDEDDLIIAQNDDISDENTNSSVQITLPHSGAYRIFVNGYDESDLGRYTIQVVEAMTNDQ
jgi:hypothetical protein